MQTEHCHTPLDAWRRQRPAWLRGLPGWSCVREAHTVGTASPSRPLPACPHSAARTLCRALQLACIAVLLGLTQGAPSRSAAAQALPSAMAAHAASIDEAATRFGVSPALIVEVIRAESGGRVDAVSPVGAMGLMQVMPATYAALRVRHGLGADPFDPRDNILAGAAYLREMTDRFGTDGAIAAYHAGPGRYAEHLATGRPLPPETLVHVQRISARLALDRLPGRSITPPPSSLPWAHGPLFVLLASDRTAASPSLVSVRGIRHPATRTVQDGGIFIAPSVHDR